MKKELAPSTWESPEKEIGGRIYRGTAREYPNHVSAATLLTKDPCLASTLHLKLSTRTRTSLLAANGNRFVLKDPRGTDYVVAGPMAVAAPTPSTNSEADAIGGLLDQLRVEWPIALPTVAEEHVIRPGCEVEVRLHEEHRSQPHRPTPDEKNPDNHVIEGTLGHPLWVTVLDEWQ